MNAYLIAFGGFPRRGRTRAEHQLEVLVQNTQLTGQIAWLTNELHQAVCVGAKLAR